MENQTFVEFVCGDRLLVGWMGIADYFQLPANEMRDRFGRELRGAGIVFELYMFNNAPCSWQTSLQKWAVKRGLL